MPEPGIAQMATQLRLRPEQIADLEQLMDLGCDRLREIEDNLSNPEFKALHPDDLSKRVIELVGNAGTGDRMFSVIFSLAACRP